VAVRETTKQYVIYDGRAKTEGTDEAAVLSCACSLKEARKDARMFGYECDIYVYDLDEHTRMADNEQYVETYMPTDAGVGRE
jgi:hypothetical protein